MKALEVLKLLLPQCKVTYRFSNVDNDYLQKFEERLKKIDTNLIKKQDRFIFNIEVRKLIKKPALGLVNCELIFEKKTSSVICTVFFYQYKVFLYLITALVMLAIAIKKNDSMFELSALEAAVILNSHLVFWLGYFSTKARSVHSFFKPAVD